MSRGTVHTSYSSTDASLARKIRDAILTSPALERDQEIDMFPEAWIVSILEKNDYSLKKIRTAMSSRMKGNGGTMYV